MLFDHASRFEVCRTAEAPTGEHEPVVSEEPGGGGEPEPEPKPGVEARWKAERDAARQEGESLKAQFNALNLKIQQDQQERAESQRRIKEALGTIAGVEVEAEEEPPHPLDDPKGYAEYLERRLSKSQASRQDPAEIDRRVEEKFAAKEKADALAEFTRLNQEADAEFRKSRHWADPDHNQYDPVKRLALENFVLRLSGSGLHGSLTQEDLQLAERAILGPEREAAAASRGQREIAAALRDGGQGAASRGGSRSTGWNELSVEEAGMAVQEATSGMSVKDMHAWITKNVPVETRDRLARRLSEKNL